MDVSPGDGGTVEVDQTASSSYPASFSINSGVSVHLEALPASGYRFDNWSGDLSDTANPTTIVINCNKTVTAEFSRITHTLTIKTNGSGSTTPAVGNHEYTERAVVDITAIPDSGWQFDGWSGDVADAGSANTKVTINSNKTVTAEFSQAQPSWWLIVSIVVGVVIIGTIIWLTVRSRTA